MKDLLTAQTCRQCGKANHCAMAEMPASKDCWCTKESKISHLSCPVPEDTYCLCKSCLRQAKNEQH